MCVLAIPEAHFPDDMACKCPGPPRSAGAPCLLDEAPCPGTVLWEQRSCWSGLVNPPSCYPGSCPILPGPRLLDMMLHPPSANTVQGDVRMGMDPDPACSPLMPAPPCASFGLCLLPAPLWGRDRRRKDCKEPITYLSSAVNPSSQQGCSKDQLTGNFSSHPLSTCLPGALLGSQLSRLPPPPPEQAPLPKLGVTHPQSGASGLPSALLFLHQPSRRRGRWRRCSAKTCFQRFSLGTLQQLCWF